MSFVILRMDRVKKLITIDKEIVSGTPVFKGTRTPIYTLFEYMSIGYPLEEYFKDFPSVSEKQAREAIAIAKKFLTSEKLASLYETLAGRKSSRTAKTRSKRPRRINS